MTSSDLHSIPAGVRRRRLPVFMVPVTPALVCVYVHAGFFRVFMTDRPRSIDGTRVYVG